MAFLQAVSQTSSMERSLDKFDFHATLNTIGQALIAVVCHILFDFALVGVAVAAVLAICAFILGARKHRFARPLYAVARRVSLVCAGISLPGFACLILTQHLPDSGNYVNFTLGFLVVWSMVTIYLCAEEMNFEWFIRGQTPAELGEVDDEESAAQPIGESSPTSETVETPPLQDAEKPEPREHLSDPVRETIVKR